MAALQSMVSGVLSTSLSSVLVIIIQLVSIISVVQCFPSGAPHDSCITNLPDHHFCVAKFEDPPYLIEINTDEMHAGEFVDINLRGNTSEDKFRGFLVQARDAKTHQMLNGRFIGNLDAQSVSCPLTSTFPHHQDYQFWFRENFVKPRIGNSITHVSRDDKDSIMIQWIPPFDFEGPVYFRGTFVRNFTDFWGGVRSNVLMVKGSNPPNTTPAQFIS